jgi:monofunctional biosynthetic peptidoglycan transglycosylase
VELSDVQVEGAPLDLPVLSGTAFPTVSLVGDGVSIRPDAMSFARATPWGDVVVEVRPEADGYALSVACDACVVQHADLDPAPVHLPPVRFVGRACREGEVWNIDGEVGDGDLRVSVEARGTPDAGQATLGLGPTPLRTLYARLSEVVPEVRHARIEGVAAGTVRVRWPAVPTAGATADSTGVSVEVVPELRGVRVSGLIDDRWRAGVFTWPARDAEGLVIAAQGGEGTPDWVPLLHLGPWLPAAVVASEDGGFWTHAGFSLPEMQEAASRNAADGALRRGGSTLTQQLAKNLFLDGRRTYARKLRELLWAVDLEGRLGKLRILELYLNIAEWGPGIRGAKAAAWTYFAKSPAGLRPEEAAWLASILPYPRWAHRTQYLRSRPRTERVATILRSMQHVDGAARDAALGRAVRLVPP